MLRGTGGNGKFLVSRIPSVPPQTRQKRRLLFYTYVVYTVYNTPHDCCNKHCAVCGIVILLFHVCRPMRSDWFTAGPEGPCSHSQNYVINFCQVRLYANNIIHPLVNHESRLSRRDVKISWLLERGRIGVKLCQITHLARNLVNKKWIYVRTNIVKKKIFSSGTRDQKLPRPRSAKNRDSQTNQWWRDGKYKNVDTYY